MTQTAGAVDIRVQRTREALLTALRELLMERGYERLTIQQIIDRAQVGRATFYAHFQSKEELLEASIDGLATWLKHAWAFAPSGPLGFTLPFFQHLHGHQQIYRTTITRERETTVPRFIRRMLRTLVATDIANRRTPGVSDDTAALATQFVVGSLWSTITWWMNAGPVLSPDEINARFQQMTLPGLDAMIGSATTR
jgi:AcrR family transcriptional regulator